MIRRASASVTCGHNDGVPTTALDPDIAARLKRAADGLVPAIVQQHGTGEVLMLGWMDDAALARTLTTGRATYWSRSRQEYWVKGETSGHRQWVREVRLDCDGDALLVTVDQEGPACHTGDEELLRRRRAAPRAAPAARARWLSGRGPADLRSRRWWSGWPAPGLAAMAGTETWVGRDVVRQPAASAAIATGDAPAATAVALALLASWGVLLVTRGRLRRVVSVLAALLSLGLVAAVVARSRLGAGRGPRRRSRASALDCQDARPRLGWFWAAVAALPLRGRCLPWPPYAWCPSWPEMGRRYDAPAEAAPEPAKSPEEQENLDLWKAMDEGRDPTA